MEEIAIGTLQVFALLAALTVLVSSILAFAAPATAKNDDDMVDACEQERSRRLLLHGTRLVVSPCCDAIKAELPRNVVQALDVTDVGAFACGRYPSPVTVEAALGQLALFVGVQLLVLAYATAKTAALIVDGLAVFYDHTMLLVIGTGLIAYVAGYNHGSFNLADQTHALQVQLACRDAANFDVPLRRVKSRGHLIPTAPLTSSMPRCASHGQLASRAGRCSR